MVRNYRKYVYLLNKFILAKEMAQLAKHLPYDVNDLNSTLKTHIKFAGTLAHTCNPNAVKSHMNRKQVVFFFFLYLILFVCFHYEDEKSTVSY